MLAVEISMRETFRKSSSGFESNDTNIDRKRLYRDAKLSSISNSDAAEELKKTSWIDGMAENQGKRKQKVRRYIDSSLAAKTNEQGYEWLKR